MVGARRPRGERRAEGGDVDRAVGVGGDGLDEPAPKPSSRSDRSMVAWRSSLATTRTARRADQPVALDVPADLGEDVVARGGEADGVGLPARR